MKALSSRALWSALGLLVITITLASCGGSSGSGGDSAPWIGTWHLAEVNGDQFGGEILRITSTSTGSYTSAGVTTSFAYTKTGNYITFTSNGVLYYLSMWVDASDRLHLAGNGNELIYVRA